MNQAVFIFIAGLSGVFIGMGCLYLAIRVNACFAGAIQKQFPEKEKEK